MNERREQEMVHRILPGREAGTICSKSWEQGMKTKPGMRSTGLRKYGGVLELNGAWHFTYMVRFLVNRMSFQKRTRKPWGKATS